MPPLLDARWRWFSVGSDARITNSVGGMYHARHPQRQIFRLAIGVWVSVHHCEGKTVRSSPSRKPANKKSGPLLGGRFLKTYLESIET